MIAVDTSVMAALLAGETGAAVDQLVQALQSRRVMLPPVVVTELLSGPRTAEAAGTLIAGLQVLEVVDGYWERAGMVRRGIRKLGLKAHLADALIAQSCIDHDVPLLTRDTDFRHYAKHCGLKLA
jgi:hypothetical protein